MLPVKVPVRISSMPLGLHRDSLQNLCEVASREDPTWMTDVQTTQPVVDYMDYYEDVEEDYNIGLDPEEEEDDDEEESKTKYSVEEKSADYSSGLRKRDDNTGGTVSAWDKLHGSQNGAMTYGWDTSESIEPYQSFYYDPYSPSTTAMYHDLTFHKQPDKRHFKQLLCCFLTPWKTSSTEAPPGDTVSMDDEDDDSHEDESSLNIVQPNTAQTATSINNTSPVQTSLTSSLHSTKSPLIGMVLAPTPSPQAAPTSSDTIGTGTSTISAEKKLPGLKSIIKKYSKDNITPPSKTATNSAITSGATNKNTAPPSRRSIIPQVVQYHETYGENKKKHRVRFDTMARSIVVPSRYAMGPDQSAAIWWSRSDYDSFKKTGRVIAQAMLNGGSEIWMTIGHGTNNNNAVVQDSNTTTAIDANKWWCKFGHSRRGLEHIADINEGRLRQKSVQNSVEAVMKEQKKQRMSNANDPLKLARVSQQYTRWAKELAIVAGLSDAEAVRTKFQEVTTGSTQISTRAKMTHPGMYSTYMNREFTLAGDVGFSNNVSHPSVLDANTASSLLVRLNEEYQLHKIADIQPPKAQPAGIVSNTGTNITPISESSSFISNRSSSTSMSSVATIETCEPVHDPKTGKLASESISRKAAGYGHGENEVDRFLEKRFERGQVK